MSIDLCLQIASDAPGLPSDDEFTRWAAAALEDHPEATLTIRIVDQQESRQLNATYRHRDKPTNVLSFPADLPPEIDLPLLGDIVLCAPLVAEEAQAQGKPERAHWAHLTVHGVLHLLGYDHQSPADAKQMELLEVGILASMGIANPYECVG